MINQRQTFGKITHLKSFFFVVGMFFSSILLFPSSLFAQSPIKQVCANDQCFNVEIADTAIKRAHGLQGRKELADDEGMLFIFEAPDIYNFWMKDTLISLDMIWIDENKKIVDIKTHVPPCVAEPCAMYGPSGKASFVLEIKAGQAEVRGIKAGDELVFK